MITPEAERKHSMSERKNIEIFSAGCPVCEETVRLVNELACPQCDVSVLDMNQAAVAERAQHLGVKSVPSVVIDGELADCCAGRQPDETSLRAAIGV